MSSPPPELEESPTGAGPGAGADRGRQALDGGDQPGRQVAVAHRLLHDRVGLPGAEPHAVAATGGLLPGDGDQRRALPQRLPDPLRSARRRRRRRPRRGPAAARRTPGPRRCPAPAPAPRAPGRRRSRPRRRRRRTAGPSAAPRRRRPVRCSPVRAPRRPRRARSAAPGRWSSLGRSSRTSSSACATRRSSAASPLVYAPSCTVLFAPWKSLLPVVSRSELGGQAAQVGAGVVVVVDVVDLEPAEPGRGHGRRRRASSTVRPRAVAAGWAKTLTPPAPATRRTASSDVELELVDPVAAAGADPLRGEGLGDGRRRGPARRAPARRAGARRCRRRAPAPAPRSRPCRRPPAAGPCARRGRRASRAARAGPRRRRGSCRVEQVGQQVQADAAGDAGDLGPAHERQARPAAPPPPRPSRRSCRGR